jgi:uncharacterized protein YjbI with pentapeptide repeats
MSQQKPDPARSRPRRVTAKSKTPPGNGSQPPEKAPAQPAPDDREGWKTYWKERQQPWRSEPEISAERQKYLAERRAAPPDVQQGIYPFRNIKLGRADIEWLLQTHDNGHGPLNPENEEDIRQIISQKKGLDLRGADLSKADLHELPLAGILGGLSWLEIFKGHTATSLLRDMAKIRLEGADLSNAHLEGACLNDAYLQQAILWQVHLENASLADTHLEGASLRGAHLEGAYLAPFGLDLEEFGEEFEADETSQSRKEDTDQKQSSPKEIQINYVRLKKTSFREIPTFRTLPLPFLRNSL